MRKTSSALQQRLTDHLAAPDPRSPRERLWQVRAKRIVLATGAFERPLVFPDNDRPGIMLAEAARTLVARYGVKPARASSSRRRTIRPIAPRSTSPRRASRSR